MTTTPSREALLPCPFCGSDAIAMHPNDLATDGGQLGVPGHGCFYAHCDGCGAEGPQADFHVDAITAWNTRAAELTASKDRKRLSDVYATRLVVDDRGRPMTLGRLQDAFVRAREAAGVAAGEFQLRDLRADHGIL